MLGRKNRPVPLCKDTIDNIVDALENSLGAYPQLSENAALCLRSILDGLDDDWWDDVIEEAAIAARTIMPKVEKCAKNDLAGVSILLGLGYLYLLYHTSLAQSFESYGQIATTIATQQAEQYRTPPLKNDPSVR